MKQLSDRVNRLGDRLPASQRRSGIPMDGYTNEQIDAMAAAAEDLTVEERGLLDAIRPRLAAANGDLDAAGLTAEELVFAAKVRGKLEAAIDQHMDATP